MARLAIAFIVLLTTSAVAQKPPEGPGLAAKYPGDKGIAKDPAVLFADDFESGDLARWDDKSGTLAVTDDRPNAGTKCATAPMEKGKNNGGEAKKWFLPGADRVYARTYVRFSPDYQYAHHFLTLLASPRSNKWKPFGKAGIKPDGTYFNTEKRKPLMDTGEVFHIAREAIESLDDHDIERLVSRLIQ